MNTFKQFLERAEEISEKLKKEISNEKEEIIENETILQMNNVECYQMINGEKQSTLIAKGNLYFLKPKNEKDFFFLSIENFQFPLNQSNFYFFYFFYFYFFYFILLYFYFLLIYFIFYYLI